MYNAFMWEYKGVDDMKRRIAFFLIGIFMSLNINAYALGLSNIRTSLRIGLKTYQLKSMTIKFNGNYSFDGQVYSQGTSAQISIINNKVDMNGKQYDTVLLVPQSAGTTMQLVSGIKKYNYSGEMEFTCKGGTILPVNIVDIEDYIKGVVAFEMSNAYPIEALKAQAVTARNYSLTNLNKHKSEGYDLCDTTDCQVYRGYNAQYTNVIRAVEDTRGKVLTYNNQLASTFYGASSGGYTEAASAIWNGNLPYLLSKADPFESDGWPAGNLTFSGNDISTKLKQKGYITAADTFNKIDTDSMKKDASGRVSSLDIIYTDKNGVMSRKTLTKEAPRTFLSLPSALYTVTYTPETNQYVFSGKGYGHGVGLSQVGAKNRANAGQTFDQILSFYFDSTSIADMNNVPDRAYLAVNNSTALSGGTVTYTIDNMNPGELYRIKLEKAGVSNLLKDYSQQNTGSISLMDAGDYTLVMQAKKTGSLSDYDYESRVQVSAYREPTITSVNIASSKFSVGDSPSISVTTANGSPGGISYSYELTKDGAVVNKTDTRSPAYSYKLPSMGNYRLTVRIKDSLAQKEFDDMKEISFTAGAAITSSSSKPSSVTPSAINKPSGSDSTGGVLTKGSKGSKVLLVQSMLIKQNILKVTKATDYFGTATEKAVIEFQKRLGMKATGKVDDETYQKMLEVTDLIDQQGGNAEGISAADPVSTPDTKNVKASSLTPEKRTVAKKTGKTAVKKNSSIKKKAVKSVKNHGIAKSTKKPKKISQKG